MIVCIGTVCCLQVDELAQMQICDLLWSWDAAYHQSLWVALVIRIIRRKQDSGRYGLYHLSICPYPRQTGAVSC